MEPEPPISYNQVSISVEGLGHHPSCKLFDLQFLLPTRCAKDGIQIVGMTNQ